MSNSYAAVTALIFTIVAVMHLVRIISGWSVVIGPRNISMNGLEVVMSSIKRLGRATTTWLTRAGSVNDLTTLSDRDLRDLGLVRRQIGINRQQVISVGNFL
jgi:uncharacterized protein YjiS (DUF1127 family)